MLPFLQFLRADLFCCCGLLVLGIDSVFTVEKVGWSSDPDESHLVVLQAAIDNLREPDDLPLCPWY